MLPEMSSAVCTWRSAPWARFPRYMSFWFFNIAGDKTGKMANRWQGLYKLHRKCTVSFEEKLGFS